MEKKPITTQLRNLGYNNKEIKTIYNRHFRIGGWKNFDSVVITRNKPNFFALRFFDFEEGYIVEISAEEF